MIRWIDEVYDSNRRLGLRGQTLFAMQSQYQHIEIVETEAHGRGLLLDGMWMTVEADEKVYHQMLVHPALTTAPSIENVLVIGGGDGGTIREVLRYKDVKRVVLAEIDGDVVEVSRRFLPNIGTAWDDPRLEVCVCDGTAFVANAAPGSWDVILVDGSDPIGPAKALFEDAFFAACARVLAGRGVLSVQGGSPTAQYDEHISTIQVMKNHFSQVAPMYAPIGIYPGGAWSFVWGTSSDSSIEQPLLDRIQHVESDTYWYNHSVHLGALAQPNHVRRVVGLHR